MHVPPPFDLVKPNWNFEDWKMRQKWDDTDFLKNSDDDDEDELEVLDEDVPEAVAPPPLPSPQFGLPNTPIRRTVNKKGATRSLKGYRCRKLCYVCRGWEKKQIRTAFECSKCKMPLCNPAEGLRKNRISTCLDEHKKSTEDEIRCSGTFYARKRFPDHLKRYKLENQKYM